MRKSKRGLDQTGRCVQGGADELMAAATKLALDLAAGRAKRQFSLTRTDKLISAQEAEPLFLLAKAQVRRS